MLSIGMSQCRYVVHVLVRLDVNDGRLVGRIDGDPVVLEMRRVNLLRRRARNNFWSIAA